MADLFLQIAVSLDGYIEAADKNIEWMEFDTSFDPVATATLRSIRRDDLRPQVACPSAPILASRGR